MLGSLLGNYRVVERLGEGGMGAVYIGRHEALSRRVVVKVLQPELCSDTDMVQRFFNEARAATSVRSPGIVQVFDFGTTSDDRAYIVMELLEGESLAARLRHRRYDAIACCRIGRQVANVLQAAHDAGITHRDLKPANLFLVLDPEVAGGERVKVLDFGIAKLGESRFAGVQTRTGLVMGTPYYMSPEQCRSASIATARSDIYSLGCILFEIACGRPPFAFEGVGDVVAAHLHEPPPHPQSLAPDLPPPLAGLIANMLAKSPDARPQTMTAVGQALDDILQLLESSAGRIPTPFPVPPPLALAPPIPPLPAQPVPLPPPQPFSSMATTLKRWVIRPGAYVRRLTFVLGALVVLGAITAIAIVLATAGPAEHKVSYADIVPARSVADAGLPDVAVAQLPVPDASAVIPAQKPAQPPTEALEAECQGYLAARKWSELAECAEKLRRLDAKGAEELKTRAQGEARSAPHIANVESALHDNNLKRAKVEMDQVWPESVAYTDLKHKYDAAEVQEINALATQLESVKDTSCEAYNQLLSKARATNSPSILSGAARRSPCKPPPKCDVGALTARAAKQFNANRVDEALALLEEAYRCRPGSDVLQKALVVACSASDTVKAKSYWKRMSPGFRAPALGTCTSHGITEATLNAP
ncbi:MAG TPA: serine/threonine-protein kinase [Kofleriaceae bacterium]